MRIEKITPCYNFQPVNRTVSFGSAADINLKYVLKNHSKFLPDRILNKIKELIDSDKSQKPLYEVHNEVYKALFEAKTLDEVKKIYPEFREVNDINILQGNRSKALKAIEKVMPLEHFTLDYLKKIYKPTPQEKLVEEYGFTNRSLLMWLNERLNIKKLSGSYLQLLKMSDEKENQRIAELSRRAIYADAEAQKYRLQRAAEAHRTPEYRAKKKQEMKNFYLKNPQMAKKTGIISQRTWDKCPEIKTAFSEYTKNLSPFIKQVLFKRQTGHNLTDMEKRISRGYYKGFWEQHPELKQIYKQRRIEVIEEMNKELETLI